MARTDTNALKPVHLRYVVHIVVTLNTREREWRKAS